jgi:hypothetical protein
MVDFDDLKGKAEALLGEHADQVEDGIDKLADVAGKKFGHAGQIDQAAEKLKGLVDDQQAGPHKGGPQQRGPRQGGPRPAGQKQRGPGDRPQPGQGGPRAGGKGPGQRPGAKPGPRPQSG